MRDILEAVSSWLRTERKVALATVVATWGSAPRAAGSRMAVSEDGGLAGSVSGGCVETAVVQAAREVLQGAPPRLLHFGVADETAWVVGLACGGTIEVFVEPLDPALFAAVRDVLARDEPVAATTVISGPGPGPGPGTRLLSRQDGAIFGTLEGPLGQFALDSGRAALENGRPARSRAGEWDLYVDVLRPLPTLVIVGGVHIAVALVTLARAMGFRTVVVDPRPTFSNRERFPHADRLENAWPDEALAGLPLTASTAVAVLTHDPKLDDPALRTALPSAAFYVGALGSQKTQGRRRQRLLEAGLTESQLDRLHAPIGLDLGGRSPEEIALAVMAEVVAARNGRPRSRDARRATTSVSVV
jgi:xanthine dehydrogenase accessory factor